jgi:hypothetical protein
MYSYCTYSLMWMYELVHIESELVASTNSVELRVASLWRDKQWWSSCNKRWMCVMLSSTGISSLTIWLVGLALTRPPRRARTSIAAQESSLGAIGAPFDWLTSWFLTKWEFGLVPRRSYKPIFWHLYKLIHPNQIRSKETAKYHLNGNNPLHIHRHTHPQLTILCRN